MSRQKKINSIVVGSGFGGIASALRLRALGHNVTLVDRLPEIGGRAQVFNLKGFPPTSKGWIENAERIFTFFRYLPTNCETVK